MFDVTVIGAGVIGCSIARELSRYNLNICVLEKDDDVACGTTRANSAIVHAGYDAKPGTLKAKFNVEGNPMFDKLAQELEFPFKRVGSLVVCFNKDDIPKLEKLKDQGEKNGVPDLKILLKDELMKIEPNLNDNVEAALYAPTAGIVCPYEMTIAFAENAHENGVDFKFNTQVVNILKHENGYKIETNNGVYETKAVVNAAGVFSDEMNNMVSQDKITIVPRKGEYCLFDKAAGNLVSMTIFQLPTSLGKGILVSPTIDGNLIVGPTAVDIKDKNDVSTSKEGLDEALKVGALSVKYLPLNQIITSFAGLRARGNKDDFILGEAQDAENFFNAAGIESPGLTSAPAIAVFIRDEVVKKLNPGEKTSFNPIRKGITRFRELSNDERRKLISENPSYGRIVCRCETVTEGEVLAAIRRPLGARTLDGVKRRTRCGMGRCQSGFCSTRIVDILAKELRLPLTNITKFGKGSWLLSGKNKENVK